MNKVEAIGFRNLTLLIIKLMGGRNHEDCVIFYGNFACEPYKNGIK